MPEIALTFCFELLEDLHAGTGVGRLGIVDDTQGRDQAGNPVVWASTLRGLLREAGEDWLWARKEAGINVDADRAKMQRLLGRTVESGKDDASSSGIAIVSSLRLAEGSDATFVVWASTAREVNSRRPDDKTLRQVEHAAAGTTFRGEIRVPHAQDGDAEFLKSLLKRVTALGGTRNRGWGQVQFKCIAAAPMPTVSVSPNTSKKLRLVLRNREPLNLATTAMAGNLIGCQSYIPGARLRAALLHWLSNNGQEQLAETLAKSMSVGNAYVVPGDPKKVDAQTVVMPLPLSIQAPKGGQGKPPTNGKDTAPNVEPGAKDKGGVPWWATPENNGLGLSKERERDVIACPLPKPDEKDEHTDLYPTRCEYKRIKTEDYAVLTATGWHRVRPKIGVLLRNAVPTSRRDGPISRDEARTEKAALFSEQVLWEDQVFIVELRFEDEVQAVEWQKAAAPLLGGACITERSWLRVGRGGRPVVIEKCEAAQTTTFPSSKYNLTLTLTSDLIARTPWLTFLTDLTKEDLARLIQEADGPKLCTNEIQIENIKPKPVETTEVYGFNSATGLPRAAAIALKRGSVFRIRSDSSDAIKAWCDTLEKIDALGERTLDGFGRFVLDLPLHVKEYWGHAKPGDAPSVKAQERPLLETILEGVDGLLKSWKLGDKSAKVLRSKRWPSITQWQWLRTQADVSASIEGVLADLRSRAETLGGHQWNGCPVDKNDSDEADKRTFLKHIDDATEGYSDDQKRPFLRYVAQAVIAQMRRRRRAMED